MLVSVLTDDYTVDARLPLVGGAPANGVAMALRECNSNLTIPSWTYTTDNKVVSVAGSAYMPLYVLSSFFQPVIRLVP